MSDTEASGTARPMSVSGPLERAWTPGLGVELREAEPDGGESEYLGVLTGHFARFHEWTEIDSLFEGRFLEQIKPGAFKKTLREQRDRIKVLFQHGRDMTVGDKPLGPILDVREDDEGVFYEVGLIDTAYNRELLPGLREGLYGASFRMQVLREEWSDAPDPSDYNPAGLPERTIKEVRLFEFGPVTFPAYAGATAGLRSRTDEIVIDLIRRSPSEARALFNESVRAVALERATTSPGDAGEDGQHVAPADVGAAHEHEHVGTPTDARREGPETQESTTYGLVPSTTRPRWAL